MEIANLFVGEILLYIDSFTWIEGFAALDANQSAYPRKTAGFLDCYLLHIQYYVVFIFSS